MAGIALAYKPEALVGRKVVIVANLAPRKLRGIESQGMIVAASREGDIPVLASFLEDVPIGRAWLVEMIDSHCHLDSEQFNDDREAVIERASAAGVETMVAIGSGDGPPDLEAGVRSGGPLSIYIRDHRRASARRRQGHRRNLPRTWRTHDARESGRDRRDRTRLSTTTTRRATSSAMCSSSKCASPATRASPS